MYKPEEKDTEKFAASGLFISKDTKVFTLPI
jgi:hypothetical protein